ncbi:MAG: hypothetical protein CFE21_09310 [Bacteroidetes bacterium B1(2017)]|nr:MAG: hypothetical protein CFE21_09310 [Bacteroidetes bacterium B1(2017)]
MQCKNNAITNTFKLHENDPFKNTIVPSQTFTIDSKQDNVVEGENGTVLVCPKGCFINTKGEIVEDNVTIELSEALSIEDMLLSNLTTSSEGKQLETDGMIYFNATSKGEQLGINEDNPIHIEIPTKEKKAGMMAYKGTRDEKGNMNWIEPKALDNYLVTVDIHSLDFLPPGFETEVDKGMPYKNHKTATQDLTDSLFYQLAVYKGDSRIIDNIDTQYIEPYKNKSKQVIKDEYTPDSYQEHSTEESVHESSTPETTCGIDPASIKVIKSEKYQNTFIATREFEARLKIIFKTCNKAVLETYLNNLNLNLYEVDNLAANTLGESNHYYENFVNFAKQQLTKVQQADKYAELLKGYYGKQLLKVKSELEMEQEKLMKVLKKKNLEAQKVAEDYKKLLWKREKYRMETYGFNWSETGWINIDNGTLPKSWESKVTEGIYVDNGQEFDRVYCYYVFTSIKSLYRLNTTNNIEFYAVNYDQGKEMLMPKDGTAILISIGYKGQTPSIDIKEFDLNLPINYHLTLATSTIEQVKEAIKPFEKYAQENKINKDLEFMAKFYQEEQRQKELIQETEFMRKLWTAAFPCCAGPQAAATLEY